MLAAYGAIDEAVVRLAGALARIPRRAPEAGLDPVSGCVFSVLCGGILQRPDEHGPDSLCDGDPHRGGDRTGCIVVAVHDEQTAVAHGFYPGGVAVRYVTGSGFHGALDGSDVQAPE